MSTQFETSPSETTPADSERPGAEPAGAPRSPGWDLLGGLPASADGEGDGAFEVRRNSLVAGVVGVAAALLGVAWGARALDGGGALTWALVGLLAVLAITHLAAFVDAGTPLAVIDRHGVRMRLGRTWQGLPWSTVDGVELHPRTGLLRDGRLVLHPFAVEEVLANLDGRGRRQARMNRMLHGAPFAVPLALSTRVAGAPAGLQAALESVIADDVPLEVATAPVVEPASVVEPAETAETPVVELAEAAETPVVEPAETAETAAAPVVEPAETAEPAESAEAPARRDPRPALAGLMGRIAEARSARAARRAEPLDDREPLDPEPLDAEPLDHEPAASPPVLPTRDDRPAVRAEIVRPSAAPVPAPALTPVAPADDADDAPATQVAAAIPAEPEPEPEPVTDPVVGPQLTAARTRLGLSIDQVAERTRIRPHVIEAIEVDDFEPCGGDFYARGHLRTLARVLGVDGAALVAEFDERYSHAPISPRRIFEAELASGPGGSIRATRGGPNWSVLVAAVMALVLLYSVTQLLFQGPQAADDERSGEIGIASAVSTVAMSVRAGDEPASVTVRDGVNDVVWQGDLEPGQSRIIELAPPIRISSSDGAVAYRFRDGQPTALGEPGRAAQRTITP